MMIKLRYRTYIIAVISTISLLLAASAVQAKSDLSDGTYMASYLVLKAEDDSVSMANDYWEKPATILIENGEPTIRLTINHSKWVTEFKVPSAGGHADAKVISRDKTEDKRVVEFKVDDLSQPIISKIHVTVADIDYDHDYTIRMVFNQDSFKLVKAAQPEPKETTPAKQEEKKPVATEKPAQPASTAKPATGTKPVKPAASDMANEQTTANAEAKAEAVKATKPAQGKSEVAIAASQEETAKPSAAPSEQPVVEEASSEVAAGTASEQSAPTEEAGQTAEIDAEAETVKASTDQAVVAAEVLEVQEQSGSRTFWVVTIPILIAVVGATAIWMLRKRAVNKKV
jgi:heme uptake protein IsdC